MTKELITLTLAAEEYIAEKLQEHPGKLFLIGVDGKGCAGLQYKYDLITEDQIGNLDVVIERDWGKVVIDNSSVMYLIGATLNLKEDLWSSELVWINPQAASSCGCGKSFSPVGD